MSCPAKEVSEAINKELDANYHQLNSARGLKSVKVVVRIDKAGNPSATFSIETDSTRRDVDSTRTYS